MRTALILLAIAVPAFVHGYCLFSFANPHRSRRDDNKKEVLCFISAGALVILPFIVAAITQPETNATLMDKTFVPSGYMYNWDAKQLEQRIERRETRYYFIVRKDDGRIVEERVDSATYTKTDVGERILVD